jgi:hypothetical protein
MRWSPATGLVFTLAVACALAGCRRSESHAALPGGEAWEHLAMTDARVTDVGDFLLPRDWHLSQGQYPSEFEDQNYQMVRAAFDRHDQDRGLLSIDISPSHPRIWRRPLTEQVAQRMKALGSAGPLTQSSHIEPHALAYEAEERIVAIGDELRTVFRVFRQRSRVISVAYTAAPEHFEQELAERLVHIVSESMRIDLPVVEVRPPDLSTEKRTIAGVVTALLPTEFEFVRHRTDISLVPTEVLELAGQGLSDNDRPLLTLSVLRLSLLGPGVEIEGMAVPTGGQEVATGTGDPHATVIQVDADTLAAVRVTRVGGDVLTMTYAAPDYLFEVKAALGLLDTIAQSATVAPLP